jgi:RND family efflux transporter MFP subunit
MIKEGRSSFLKKRSKKFLSLLRTPVRSPRQPSKSFLLLFFKKEVLSSVFLSFSLAAAASPLPDATCQIVSAQRVELAAPASGVLSAVLVDRGDRVKKGQLLAQLHDEVEQAQLADATARAAGQGQVRARAAKLALAERALARNADLHAKNFISEQDYDQLVTDRDVAAHELETAKDALVQARAEMGTARAALALRQLRSPINGVVTERDLNPGERVGEKPVLVLERTDLLYAEVQLPVVLLSRLHVGQRAKLDFSDVPGFLAREAVISVIDPAADPKSGTLGVRFNIDNEANTLPSGIKCHVDLPGFS